MTPKEKAKELYDKFYDKAEDFPVLCGTYCQGGYIDKIGLAKQCALISINETIEHLRLAGSSLKVKWEIIFLNSVIEEINKL